MTQFVNAQDMHRAHPRTFEVPDPSDLDGIKPGTSAKICAGRERFWVEVTAVRVDGEITGVIDNDLICTDEHGLKCGDLVTFRRENVYQVMPGVAR